MTDEHDPHLRDALRSEADGIEADPRLLDRINAIVSSPEPGRSGRRRLLAVAAAFVVAAGTVGVLTQLDDDEQQVDVAGGDTTTAALNDPCPGPDLGFGVVLDAPPDEVADLVESLARDPRVRSATLGPPPEGDYQAELLLDIDSTDNVQALAQALFGTSTLLNVVEMRCDAAQVSIPSDQTPRHQGVPAIVALVREDGWLVVADLATGRVTPVFDGGDPDEVVDPDFPSVRSYIDSIEVSPDGQWVYFNTCCEPGGGWLQRVPTGATGPIPPEAAQTMGDGHLARISPDGQWLAMAYTTPSGEHEAVRIRHIDDQTRGFNVDVDGYITDLAWAPDGRHLGVRLTSTPGAEDATGWISTVTLRNARLAQGRLVPQALVVEDPQDRSDTRRFPLFAHDSAPLALDPDRAASARSVRTDAFSTALLWVGGDGAITATAPSGGELALPALPRARLADW